MALVFVWFIAQCVPSFARAVDVHVELIQHRHETAELQESAGPV